jgi:hypothetical protein
LAGYRCEFSAEPSLPFFHVGAEVSSLIAAADHATSSITLLKPDVPSPHAPLKDHAEGFLNFFFVHVPLLQAAFWQSRSEPVKVLPLRSGRGGGAFGDL